MHWQVSLTSSYLRTSHEFRSAFKQRCSALYAQDGDGALAISSYDRAIELYSMSIDLDPANETYYAKRCKAKLGKMLWEEALIDAEKVPHRLPVSSTGSF